MIAIQKTAATKSAIGAAENFMDTLDSKYNGSIYLAIVGRFMMLMKAGKEIQFEDARMVRPVLTPTLAATCGFTHGVEKALWAHYRKNFAPEIKVEGQWSTEEAIKRGGMQVHEDYDVFMYPRPAKTQIEGIDVVVMGDHSALSFTSGKAKRIESTMYEAYREDDDNTKVYNENMTRALNNGELQSDAKFQVGKVQKVVGSISDRMHDMRDWWEEAWADSNGEEAENNMLERMEKAAIRLFSEAKRAHKRIEAARQRMSKLTRVDTKKQMQADILEIERNVVSLRNEAWTMRKLAAHLENLIVTRMNGGFEEQNLAHGGQLHEIINTWKDAFDSRDTSWTERLHYATDLAVTMAKC